MWVRCLVWQGDNDCQKAYVAVDTAKREKKEMGQI